MVRFTLTMPVGCDHRSRSAYFSPSTLRSLEDVCDQRADAASLAISERHFAASCSARFLPPLKLELALQDL